MLASTSSSPARAPKITPQQLRYLLIGVAAACGLLVLGALAFIGYCAYTLPLSQNPMAEQGPGAAVYATSAGEPFAARGTYRGDKLSADHLPQNLVKAVIAIEDRRFYQHGGIDVRGMFRAGWRDLLGGRAAEGGSTITQQLARLTYLSPERSIRRKVQEIMLALWLESRLSKKEILTRYLNNVYFGAGASGAEAAAQRYFGKKAADLDLAEAAMLAGLIRAPSQLAPSRNMEGAKKRAGEVIDAMLDTDAIDKKQAEEARAHPPKLAVPPETEPNDNYFVDTAEAEVKRIVGTAPVDLSVATTFVPELQDAAEDAVRRWLDGEGARRQVGQAALIAMAPDGAILAMVGGRDYAQSQFNRVTQAHRQPGSLFKIFVYLTALANGYRPDTPVVDQPVQIGDWEPKNYDGRYRGRVSLETAFAQSLNSVAAQLIQAIGPERVVAMAKALGVQSDLPSVPSIALGSAEATLLEMTRAMNTIATDSKSIEPYTIRSIRSKGSAPLYIRPEAISERPGWQAVWPDMMRLLEAVVAQGTGRAARLPDRRSAGKTGTTDDYRDAWFVGFTTDLVVGVWVGNDDHSPMDQVAGGDIPAKIWHDFAIEAERIIARQPPAAASAALTGPSMPPPAAPSPPVTAAPPSPPAQMQPAAAMTQAAPRPLRGPALVVDTGTLVVQGAVIHLSGVEGETGDGTRDLVRYLGGRAVSCEPADAADSATAQYRCKLGEYDLSEAVLLNGAGRAAADAPERLRQAEEKARDARRGIWRR
ncbi:MAG TPA: PBP1A family penicillin-binding protein [Stellaceae bacterium]